MTVRGTPSGVKSRRRTAGRIGMVVSGLATYSSTSSYRTGTRRPSRIPGVKRD
jgi:hypothetical protein